MLARPMPRLAADNGSYVLHERAASFSAAGVGWLSVKLFIGGAARYAVGRRQYVADQAGYLVLNHGQPYAVQIEADAPVESFCLFWAPGQAEAARYALGAPLARLLDDPAPPLVASPFVERTYPHDDLLSPALFGLRARLLAAPREPGWLAEQLCLALEQLLLVHQRVGAEIARLPAARPATREELYRRVHMARDYARAMFAGPLPLSALADVAGLSPNHLLRAFRQVLGLTPHQYLTELRLGRAEELLRQTDEPVSAICLAVGFESLGSFSWLFRRRTGLAPQAYRRQFR